MVESESINDTDDKEISFLEETLKEEKEKTNIVSERMDTLDDRMNNLKKRIAEKMNELQIRDEEKNEYQRAKKTVTNMSNTVEKSLEEIKHGINEENVQKELL